MVQGGRLVQVWAAVVIPLAWPWVKAYRREQQAHEEMRGRVRTFLAVSAGASETLYDSSERLRKTL